jgi:SAM-dependent methyltransferase
MQVYERRGRDVREAIESLLPPDWSFEGKRVLDFGCGAGRVLRHFLPEAANAEFWGCDIDRRSIDWLQKHLCPPLRAYRNAGTPPLPHPDGYFDLIWALSVLTHITDTWSAWMVELHRVLADDGLLLVTFMGEGVSQYVTPEPWDEDLVGMNVLHCGESWDLGGPKVLHSPWWIRAHWGRAFEIVTLHAHGFSREGPVGQGAVLLRKKPVPLTPADLEAWEPAEPRELHAVRHNLSQVQRELASLRQSASWRVTRPIRMLHVRWAALRTKLRSLLSHARSRRDVGRRT